MTFASDKGSEPHGLAPLSQRMRELREEVIGEWARRVRAAIDAAATLREPVLVDTIPTLYDNLTQALTPDYPRTSAEVPSVSVATEHGGERARLTHYDIQSVIAEYQILRDTIHAVLAQHGAFPTLEEARIIDSAVDATIREAVTAFALVESAFRERFFAALAHDLRGPLANASISAQLIGRTDDLAKIRRHAGMIEDNIGRVDDMIRQMLDALVFQHGERLKLKLSYFDLGDMVSEVCDHLALAHGPRFEVQCSAAQGWWGRGELQRALENLVGNALKYGAADKPVRIIVTSGHERVQMAVHNEGRPIPADQLESVFQVFRRALDAKQGETQGWGIGLPYVRSVAESHGGSICIDSAPERGTTFTIDIPADARPFQDAPAL